MRSRSRWCVAWLVALSCTGDATPPLEPEPDEWVLGVLPDTQFYAERCPEVFEAQTSWLEAQGVDFVVHLGDVTDDGSESQWQVASDAMANLDGSVPYSIVLGNHDLGVSGDARDRDTKVDDWFPVERFSALLASFPEGSAANTFHQFTARTGAEVCVLALEFAPRDAVVAWAAARLAEYAECETILTTHAYLYEDGERYDRSMSPQPYHPDSYGVSSENVSDGEALHQSLVLPNPQVRMVLSGHVLGTGTALRVDRRDDGTTVTQMLSNYQTRGPCGGEGYLRVIGVSPRGLRVRTYSPTLGESLADGDHSFDLR